MSFHLCLFKYVFATCSSAAIHSVYPIIYPSTSFSFKWVSKSPTLNEQFFCTKVFEQLYYAYDLMVSFLVKVIFTKKLLGKCW